jgi:hypothetical protein
MFSTTGNDKVPSWFGSSNECDWFGITCTGNTVTKLALFEGLTGTIPDDVGLWKSLTYFDVVDNQLTGSLPSSIGLWTNLTFFNVGNNALAGSLPSTIGLWTDLTAFGVYNNQFVGTVPKEVSSWTSVQSAYFHSNLLNGTMPAIGNNFCPKNGTNGALQSDCVEIQCDCCNVCCRKPGFCK